MKRGVLFFALCVCVCVTFAQQINVTGRVTDATTGNPIPGVSVVVEGSSQGASTDFEGEFKIQAPKGGVLKFSFVGYKTKSVTVNQSQIDVALEEDSSELEEVVVTALGITKKAKTLTYAQQNVKADDLARTRDVSVVGSLSGRAAGVDIKRSTSGPGGSTKIILRGNKSVSGDSAPLFVIDGVPMANNRGNQPGMWGGNDGGDGLSQLNPDDIESMTVLRGANAAVLYGSQGANGVVVITTKKGKAGKTKVTVNSGVSFESVIETPKMQFKYGGTTATDQNSWGDKKLSSPGFSQSDVDNFFQTGMTTINGLSVSGGNDTTTAFFSYNNTMAKGVIPNNTYTKHNASFRQKTGIFNNKVKISSSLMLADEISKNRPASGYYLNPMLELYSFPRQMKFADYKKNYERFDKPRNMILQNWFNQSRDNPYWIINKQPLEHTNKRLIANLTLEYDIVADLKFKVRGNYDYAVKTVEHKLYAGSNRTNAHKNGRWSYSKQEDTLLYTDAVLSYNKNFGDVSLSALLGASYQRADYGVGVSVNSDTQGLKYANIFNFQNINDNVPVSSTYASRTAQTGYFANTQVGYKDMVFLDLSLRRDQSSTLAETGNDTYFYPAFGLTALINEMVALPDFISFAKLRASYTTVAMPVPFNRVSPTNTINPAGGGINRNTTKAFTDLKPEKINSFEVGADWRFFGNRLGFDFTYYHINSKDQFIELEAPTGSGYTSYFVNAGSIVNKGMELSLNITPVRTNDLEWRTTFNYAQNENKVEELTPELKNPITTGSSEGFDSKFEKGGSIGDIYVFKFKRDKEGRIILGNNGKPTKTQKTEYIGNANPDWSLGWANTVTYKQFSLNILLNGKFGGKVVSQTEARLDGWGVSKRTADARDAGGVKGKFVKADGTKVDKIPAKDYYQATGGRNGIKEPYVYDRTNIRVSQLAVSYFWALNNKFLKDVTFSLVGNNLLYLYRVAPFDPELASNTGRDFQSVDNFNLPPTRTYGFNVKFNF